MINTKCPHMVFNPLEKDELNVVLDRNNPQSAFYGFVGNDEVIETLFDVAYKVLQTYRRDSVGVGFAFYGPASAGKTTAAFKYAELLELPFANFAGGSIKSMKSFIDSIQLTLDQDDLEITPDEDGVMEIPAMVVLIDEVHSCSATIVNGLLTACDQNHPYFVIDNVKYSTKNIHWIVATTERGDLFGPFETRFVALELHAYSLHQIALIVNSRFNELSMPMCEKIAKYTRIPRTALAYASQVLMAATRGDISYGAAVDLIAKRKKLHPSGLDQRQIKILQFLASDVDVGKSLAQLCGYAGCSESEFKEFLTPALLYTFDDRLPLIRITNRYKITEEGLNFLDNL